MKFKLHQLLPAELSNEAAFQLVKFIRGLAVALESIYFEQMLQHTFECEHDPFLREQHHYDDGNSSENDTPF